MIVTESDIETYLRMRVKHLGGKCVKLPAVYEKGIPDRLVILPKGKIAFVELKRPKGGKLAPLQKYQLHKLHELGCIAEVVNTHKAVDALLARMTEDEVQTTRVSETGNTRD